jgi:hypothetical protein
MAQAALAPRIPFVLLAVLRSPGFRAPASAVDGLNDLAVVKPKDEGADDTTPIETPIAANGEGADG